RAPGTGVWVLARQKGLGAGLVRPGVARQKWSAIGQGWRCAGSFQKRERAVWSALQWESSGSSRGSEGARGRGSRASHPRGRRMAVAPRRREGRRTLLVLLRRRKEEPRLLTKVSREFLKT